MKQAERRNQVLEFLRTYADQHGGRMPTTREIAEGCGLRSHGTVDFHLRKLAEAGHVVLGQGKARGIEFVRQPQSPLPKAS